MSAKSAGAIPRSPVITATVEELELAAEPVFRERQAFRGGGIQQCSRGASPQTPVFRLTSRCRPELCLPPGEVAALAFGASEPPYIGAVVA